MEATQREKLTDITYQWLASQPNGGYHIKDIWAAMAREYPDKFGITDHRKTPYDTLRVMMMREGDKFVRVGPNRYFIVTKAMTEKVKPQQEKAKTTFTEEDLYGAGLDKVVLAYQESGDVSIAEKILEAVRPMMLKVVREYANESLLEDDLLQEAFLGVLKAMKTFDPKRGGAVHYIWTCSRSFITRYYENHGSLIRSAKNTPERKMLYKKADYIEYKTNRDSDRREEILEELMAKTGLTEERVKSAGEHVTYRFISIGSQFYRRSHDDENGISLEETLASDEPTPEEAYMKYDERAKFQQVIEKFKSHLTERERYILQKRLLDEDQVTFEEIGDTIGITRQRVCQIEAALIEKLKKRVSPFWRNNL